MTYLEAAIRILRTSRQAMTAHEITQAALRNGSIRPGGKTPDATMSSALYTHVRDSASTVIRRDYRAGPTRAARDSVRWRYIGR